MFSKVLVANRGEIAVRIIRSLKELGIKSVAIYSTVDRESLHVQLADEAVCVGSAKPQDSYLNMKNILAAAIGTGAQAIHPGFGFLSENSRFVEMCESCGITFIGPKSETISLMGNKANARIQMQQSGVPVIPGSEGFIDNVEEARKIAEKVGYPVLLKAAAGGGGKGIRSRTSARLFPARANTPMPQSMKTRQPPNTVFLLNFLDKIGNKAAETIPRKMLIVDKIENDLGCPMIYVK